MSKKILVLSNMYPTPEHQTFGIFVENQVKALKALGNDVEVIAITDPQGGKIRVLMKYFRWFLAVLVNLVTKGRSYDVVHAHYVFPTGMLARLYKKVLKTPYVVTAHGGDIDRMAKKNERIRQWTKEILQDADHVVAVGQALHDEIHHHFGVSKDKLSILNMGVNREVFQAYPKDQARAELNIAPDSEPIVFVGNIIREKGLDDLLLAFKKLTMKRPNLSLYLIGASRNQGYRQQLELLIQEKDICSVQFLPPIPQKELAKWMSAAEVFVLPSHIEGFGLVAVEAMSCHTPVVGTDVGGLSYLLAGGNGVLVKPKDADHLGEGIYSVLSNQTFKQQLIDKGEQKAEENAEHTLIRKLQAIYERISAKH